MPVQDLVQAAHELPLHVMDAMIYGLGAAGFAALVWLWVSTR